MDLKASIDRLVEIGEQRLTKIEPDPRYQGKFLVMRGDGNVTDLPANQGPQPTPIALSSLSSFASFLRENRDALELGKLAVLVESHRQVSLVGALDEQRRRSTFATATAPKPDLPSGYGPGQWLPLEDALIWLAVGCALSNDQAALVGVLSHVIAEETNTVMDDGMSQKVEVKTGITTRGREAVPSPATLSPFCTFAEIAQPARQFIVRLKGAGTGLSVKLIPSGSGLWEAETRKAIADDLTARLAGIAVPVIY